MNELTDKHGRDRTNGGTNGHMANITNEHEIEPVDQRNYTGAGKRFDNSTFHPENYVQPNKQIHACTQTVNKETGKP